VEETYIFLRYKIKEEGGVVGRVCGKIIKFVVEG